MAQIAQTPFLTVDSTRKSPNTNSVTVVFPTGQFFNANIGSQNGTVFQAVKVIHSMFASMGLSAGIKTDGTNIYIESIKGICNSSEGYWEILWNGTHSTQGIFPVLHRNVEQNITIRYVFLNSKT
ncbi:MAG: hypothetical protein Q8P55_01810 [bacterium]|nr:hypothetical protein [bacterium]